MTNEQFEQILRRALTPDIDDSEITLRHKKVRSIDMKAIYKITAAAACAVLIAGAGIGSVYLNRQPAKVINSGDVGSSSVGGVISQAENTFVLKVGAEEITPNKGVPLTFKNGQSSSLGGSENGGEVKYCVSADFSCAGEGIESVTYSINKGTFAVVEAHEQGGSLIKSGTAYKEDCNFPGIWPGSMNDYDPETIDTKYYTEYTLDYDSQQSKRLGISICGEIYDEDIYNKLFNFENTPEEKAEAYTELMNGVEITCTVHYADGTTDSDTVIVEGQAMAVKDIYDILAPDDDPERMHTTFIYKLK